MNKLKNTITMAIWVLLVIIAGTGAASWFMSKHIYKCKPEQVNTAFYDSVIRANAMQAEKYREISIRLSERNNAHLAEIGRLKQFREQVSNNGKNIHDEIKNTADTGQLALTNWLLSELKQYTAKGY